MTLDERLEQSDKRLDERYGLTSWEERKQAAQAAENNTLQTVSYAETSYNNADNEKPSVIAAFLPMIVLLTLIVLVSKFLKHKEKSVHYTQKPKNFFEFLKNELGVSAFVIVGIGAIFQLISYTCIGFYVDSKYYIYPLHIALLMIAFNIFFTWGIPICISLFIRHKIAKHPLRVVPSVVITAIMWFTHLLIAEIIFPDSSHGALVLVAFYVFRILNRNAREYITPISDAAKNSVQCPVCGLISPADTFFCECGYSFNQTPKIPQKVNMRIFDKENGFFDKTETSDKLPSEYKNLIDKDGFLYAVGERQGNSIKYRFVAKKDWLNLINQHNSKQSENSHSPVYNDFEQAYNNIIKEISNLYKQDKKVFSKEILLAYKFEICTFMYFLTDFIMFKTNPSAREEICLKLSADIKNNICYQIEDFNHFFDMRIDLYGSIIRGDFEPANSLMLGNNLNDDTFMQLFCLLGDCIISSHYGYIPENDVISSLRIVDIFDIVFLTQIVTMVNKQTGKYCKQIQSN